jgi:CRP-like cAMP-binding protein
MLTNLIKHINKYIQLNENSVDILQKYFKSISYFKKDFLLKEGQICNSIHFVEKGCLKMYFINDKLNEQITQFALDNWWISDYYSFANNISSTYFIQTVEKSKILSIDTINFEALLKELPEMERYFRIIMQRNVAASQLRLKQMYELSKEEFYFQFCTSFPEFVQWVPQYMIASYLGLTPEYVSELRKKK